MTSRNADTVQIHLNRADNTETVSSPHTYTFSSKESMPRTALPDKPIITNINITSAIAGLRPGTMKGKGSALVMKAEEEEGSAAGTLKDGFPISMRRVETMTFDMSHVSPPIANLFRRLMTTEVPVLAFDRVLIEENDSVVLDELLSHRLGLVPVAGPVGKMEYITESHQAGLQNLDPRRVLVFDLEAEGAKDCPVTPVYSGQMTWVPLPGQEGFASPDAPEEDRVFLVYKDILLTKLGPGQKLKVRTIAVKGIGSVHTKWSPVSTCFYEMKTSIELPEPVTGNTAETLVRACPMGVFSIEPKTQAAMVEDASRCIVCRECLRVDAYPELLNKVRIEKRKTHVQFTIESVGQLHPAQIFRQALILFSSRVRHLAQVIQSTEVNVLDNATPK